LTLVGGGVFSNPLNWIADAMLRIFRILKNKDLDVRIVCYDGAPLEISSIVEEFCHEQDGSAAPIGGKKRSRDDFDGSESID
jgi:hypothetical protein